MTDHLATAAGLVTRYSEPVAGPDESRREEPFRPGTSAELTGAIAASPTSAGGSRRARLNLNPRSPDEIRHEIAEQEFLRGGSEPTPQATHTDKH